MNFREIRQRPTTVYVILPTEELQRKAVWLRLVLSAALRACYQPGKRAGHAGDRGGLRPRPPCRD